jgi:peptidoglycan hydrolase-like protein with peptidoglycan-binding domain
MRPKASWPIVIAESEPPPEVTMGELRASAAKLLPLTEIPEVQGRLLAFGFDPGRVDGTEGPRTRAAAKAYREKRGLVPAGDSVDRNLLAALRSDPSPKAVAPKPRSNAPIDAIVRWWKTL